MGTKFRKTGAQGGNPGPYQARISRADPWSIRVEPVPGLCTDFQKTVSQISPIRPRIDNPAIPFSGSTGNDVHAHGKYGNFGLFFKIGQNQGLLNLQNSGPVRDALFRMGWNTWQWQKRPLLPFCRSPGRDAVTYPTQSLAEIQKSTSGRSRTITSIAARKFS